MSNTRSPVWVLMQHGVHKMARKKHQRALVSALVDAYMENTINPSMHTLASTLGRVVGRHTGGRRSSRGWAGGAAVEAEGEAEVEGEGEAEAEAEVQFDTRSKYLYQIVFPEHVGCGATNCAGHSFPRWPLVILNRLAGICVREGVGPVVDLASLQMSVSL